MMLWFNDQDQAQGRNDPARWRKCDAAELAQWEGYIYITCKPPMQSLALRREGHSGIGMEEW